MKSNFDFTDTTAYQIQTYFLTLLIYSSLTTSIVFPPIPIFLSDSSLIVVIKNSCGIFIISLETSVRHLISNYFCSSVKYLPSTVIYGIEELLSLSFQFHFYTVPNFAHTFIAFCFVQHYFFKST